MIKKIIITASFIAFLSTGLNVAVNAADESEKKCFSWKVSERDLAKCFERSEESQKKRDERERIKAEKKEEREKKITELKQKRIEKKEKLATQKAERKAQRTERKKINQKLESCRKDPTSGGCKKDQLKKLFKTLKNLGGKNIGGEG